MDIFKKNIRIINFISAINIILSNKILSKKYLQENNFFKDIKLNDKTVKQKDIIENWTIIYKKDLN